MITLKSDREIGLMRETGAVVAEAHAAARALIRPGITTREIDTAIAAIFRQRNATPLFLNYPGKVPFPAVTCISVNEQVVHGIPGDRKLQEGDIASIDTGCRLNGWCGDAAWTYPVGEIDAAKGKLLEVGREILEIAIEEMGRQKLWSEVARAMQRKAQAAGFMLVDNFVGHGIGREMHEDPQVPNVPDKLSRLGDFELKRGLVLAVEPMLNMGSKEVKVLSDGWTVVTRDRKPSVHFEHTIALTGAGPELLTAGVGA